MARISMLNSEQFDRELRELVAADSKTSLELGVMRIYAHRPELAKAYARFLTEFRRPGLLPIRLIELVRLRVAFHNQCRSCMAVRDAAAVSDGMSEDLVCQLEAPDEAEDLTDAERAALRFADLLAGNHLQIDDATIDALRVHFTEPEIVELGMNVAIFVGYGRLAMAWDMVDELPDRFRERGEGPITPWGSDEVVLERRG